MSYNTALTVSITALLNKGLVLFYTENVKTASKPQEISLYFITDEKVKLISANFKLTSNIGLLLVLQ